MLYIHVIHLSVNGHLDCFHVLAMVDKTALNIGVNVSFELMFFFLAYISPEVDHMATLFLVF